MLLKLFFHLFKAKVQRSKLDASYCANRIVWQNRSMENPSTWGPIQRCLADHSNADPAELVAALGDANLLPAHTDRTSLARKFEEEIAKFRQQLDKGFCGLSIHSRLARLVG